MGLSKKSLLTILILVLFAGLAAVTQEAEKDEDYFFAFANAAGIPDWVKPIRWFRSNNGGMAIEEAPSRVIAFRNKYALSIDYVQKNKLPGYLHPYYNDDYFIEVRQLYENGGKIRTQWIFRDIKGTTRVIAVFSDDDNEKQNPGFIEIFNERSYLTSEYQFLENGERNRTDYAYRNNLLISSMVFLWDEDAGIYSESYGDFLRYNRSFYLRGVERVFYRDRVISLSDSPLRVSFPRDLVQASNLKNLITEKFNAYPEFFGEVLVHSKERIVFVTDERSRILSQTLYDENDSVIWAITNTWQDDRIVSTLKKEGKLEFLAEFVYDADGDRVIERNYKNGVLERLTRVEGKNEIEELYLNGVVVLRAVWEDGRKVHETRVNNR